MQEARKIAKTLVVAPRTLKKSGLTSPRMSKKLKVLNQMMNEFGISDQEILKNPTVMAWLKSRTALLLQWYIDKRDQSSFDWSMCYEKDLPYLTSSWLQSSGYDFQLTVWNADGEQVRLKVEKVRLVKV